MSTRQELGAELTRRMQDLADRIYDQHRLDAGSTYVTNSRMESVHTRAREFEMELEEITNGVGKQYLAVAPEMDLQFQRDVYDTEGAIRDWRREVERVYYGNLHITRVTRTSIPAYRPINDALCLLAREVLGIYPVDRQYIGHRSVPVLEYRNEQGRVVGRRRL